MTTDEDGVGVAYPATDAKKMVPVKKISDLGHGTGFRQTSNPPIVFAFSCRTSKINAGGATRPI